MSDEVAAAKKRLAAEEVGFRRAVDAVLRTEEGRQVFAQLFRICGYNKSTVAVNHQTGDVLKDATLYNEARRGVYIHLRNRATPELLRIAEELAEQPLTQPTDNQEKP